MGFASQWLHSGALFPKFIEEAPHRETGIIIVVPSYNEPGITELLDSLRECEPPACRTEVIIVVNAPATASEELIENNRLTLSNIESWKRKNNPFFRLFVINTGIQQMKGWGVGMARKTGMDEALRRFDLLGKPEGVIINTDADCTVDSNYFTTIENDFLNRKDAKGCSVFYEHPLSGNRYPSEVYNSVLQYETHLRYYCQALRNTGFPGAFQTVGSAMGVKAIPYMKSGGMNRRQAGEDFYFIQKLISAGGFININSTTVYPSPRVSGRVPFGTGAAVGKMVRNNEKDFLSYNPRSFSDLKTFFTTSISVYKKNEKGIEDIYYSLPLPLKRFIDFDSWNSKMEEIKANTSSFESFVKRFLSWFNMFMVIKFLNSSHQDHYNKLPACSAALQFVREVYDRDFNGTETDLLLFLRDKERSF